MPTLLTKPTLLTLPLEIRAQILTYCINVDHLYHGDFSEDQLQWFDTEWKPEADRIDGLETLSALHHALPDLDVEGLTRDERYRQHVARVQNLPLLYVCRQLYVEAIELFYQRNTFDFYTPICLSTFANRAFELGNLPFITSIRIVIDLWDRSPQDRALWLSWQDFFEDEERGLSWWLPGLKKLILDFEPSTRYKCWWNETHVDGGRNADGDLDRTQLRKAGFDSFRDTLRRTVRVPKTFVSNLSCWSLLQTMEMEMRGMDTRRGSRDWEYVLGKEEWERSCPEERFWDESERVVDVEEWYDM